jgi:hypothetical protein
VFAGQAALTSALVLAGFTALQPVDAYASGAYDQSQDVLLTSVKGRIVDAILAGLFYLHLGVPCSSWSRLNVNLNKGTRTLDNPMGDGSLPREVLGNKLAAVAVYLISLAQKNCTFWSLENPASSLLWHHPKVKRLMKCKTVQLIRFDQCCYNLPFPDASPGELIQKDTCILTNAPLQALACRCNKQHTHIHAIGGVKIHGKWLKRSAVAGHYPSDLCNRWAELMARGALSSLPALSQ